MTEKLRIDLIARPESFGMILYGLHDTLSLAGSVYSVVTGRPASAPKTDVRIVAPYLEPFRCKGGTPVHPAVAYEEADGADIVIVANVSFPLSESPVGRFAGDTAWLRRQYQNGATIASVCTGAILLAESGLLDGREATTHWGYADFVRQHYPNVDWRTERVLTAAGPDERLVVAGGSASWQDLALYIIARFIGAAEAARAAKSLLMSGHIEGQAAYSAMPRRRNTSDMAIAECQEWLAQNYASSEALRLTAKRSGLPTRSFNRRFQLATGYRPLEYLQALRIEEAKQLLETTGSSIEAIAAEVGYRDSRSFQRLFARKAGISATVYRRKFNHSRFIEAARP